MSKKNIQSVPSVPNQENLGAIVNNSNDGDIHNAALLDGVGVGACAAAAAMGTIASNAIIPAGCAVTCIATCTDKNKIFKIINKLNVNENEAVCDFEKNNKNKINENSSINISAEKETVNSSGVSKLSCTKTDTNNIEQENKNCS